MCWTWPDDSDGDSQPASHNQQPEQQRQGHHNTGAPLQALTPQDAAAHDTHMYKHHNKVPSQATSRDTPTNSRATNNRATHNTATNSRATNHMGRCSRQRQTHGHPLGSPLVGLVWCSTRTTGRSRLSSSHSSLGKGRHSSNSSSSGQRKLEQHKGNMPP